jgi:hypothetical protein
MLAEAATAMREHDDEDDNKEDDDDEDDDDEEDDDEDDGDEEDDDEDDDEEEDEGSRGSCGISTRTRMKTGGALPGPPFHSSSLMDIGSPAQWGCSF